MKDYKNRFWALVIFTGLLFAAALSASVPPGGIAGTVELDEPSNGYSSQNNNVTFIFIYHQNDDTRNYTGCLINIDGSPNVSGRFKSENESILKVSGLERKTHTWNIECEAGGNSGSHDFTILPLDPPKVTLTGPIDQAKVTGPTVDFFYRYDSGSDELNFTTCTLVVGPLVQGQGTAISGQNNKITSQPLHPALYPWYVQCQNKESNAPLKSTQTRLVTVLEPPVNLSANLSNNSNSGAGANGANATANQTPSTTFVNQQVVIDAPAYAKVAKPVVLTLTTYDRKPVAGATIIVFTAEGTPIRLEPTDVRGQIGFSPSTLGEYTYSVESLLLVKKSTTMVTLTGQPKAFGNDSVGQATMPSIAGGTNGAGTGGTDTIGTGSGLKNKSGSVGAAGANANASATPSNSDISLPLLVGAIGAVIVIGIAVYFLRQKPGLPKEADLQAPQAQKDD